MVQREGVLRHGDGYHLPSGKKKEKKEKEEAQTFPLPFSSSSLFSILHSLSSPQLPHGVSLPLSLSFCITYKGSRFLQNEATYGRYANEIIAHGLERDTIYPKS